MSKEKSSIIQLAKTHVEGLLKDGLVEGMDYHDISHTWQVWQAAKNIGKLEGAKKKEREWLQLAALFHDTGFTKTYQGHEEVGVEIAKSFLLTQDYPGEEISQVSDLIMATKMGHEPTNHLERIIRDADMSHMGGKGYAKRIAALRKEWALFNIREMTDDEWVENNLAFLLNHKFATAGARELYQKGKGRNIDKMKTIKKDKTASSLSSSKSAQMMFKTALRNHIDLTNLADNKANIMLSINAIIITISLPIIPSYVAQDHHIIIPAILLIGTCISSVITATLATRPIAMTGMAKPEHIKTGAANLFFFGNFYKMSQDQYYNHLSEVIADEEILEKSIISDLYHLGATMGKKYRLLRLCYTIFMIGMSLTVISMALLPLFSHA